MPDYVCPECGKPIMSRATLIDGTLMHYNCYIKAKVKTRVRNAARVDSFMAQRHDERARS